MNRPHVLAALACFVALASFACDEQKTAPTTSASSSSSTASSAVATATPTASVAPTASAPPAPKVVPDAIAAQHVLVAYKGAKGAPKTVTRSKAEAKARAEEVVAKAKGGDFSALVAEYSDDPGSKERMGSVGKFTREKMTKPFSDAAFALAVDEVSGVVESDFGFHVIKRNQ
jgi:NIMA-interacting peptidyl-prolyl cis-trans isomerase 1